jgi:arylsulfatase A-like enzyme
MSGRGITYIAVFLVCAAGLAWWGLSWAPETEPQTSAGAEIEVVAGQADGQRDVPIIIYLVDTLRADRLGVYGYSRPTSPELDALAAESVVFEQAYAPAPWTLPSVASLITSTFLCEHGLSRGQKKMNNGLKTLAEKLQSVGYTTAGYYNNLLVGSLAALDRGYQQFVFKSWNDDRRARDVDLFLDGIATRPFYLYLHTMEPHTSWSVPSKLTRPFGHVSVDDKRSYEETYLRYREQRFEDYRANRPVGATDNTALQDQSRAELESLRESINILYDGAVLEADTNLANVIRVLKRRGFWDKAIFVFLSDHGEEFGEHDGWFHDQSVYEELSRIPLIIHFPKDEFAGRRIDAVVSLVDVMPTIFDYLQRPELCAECRGNSLLPLIQENSGRRPADISVPALRVNQQSYYRAWRETRGDINVVLRQAQWKGIWNVEPRTLELYDLKNDPAESTDVSQQSAGVADRLRSHAQAWLSDCRARLKPPIELEGDELDPDTMEKLRSLGYFN